MYIDGSTTEGMKNGGAWVFINYPTADIPTGKHSSSYTAEVEALTQAANFSRSSEDQCPQVVFLTDALSVPEALDNENLIGFRIPSTKSAEPDSLCCSGFYLTVAYRATKL